MEYGILSFFGALALSVFAFELAGAFHGALTTLGRNRRLDGAHTTESASLARRSVWAGLLVVLFPSRFDPQQARDMANVVSLLRRSGYAFNTPGEFYASAIRAFTLYLVVGVVAASALVWMDIPWAAPLVVLLFAWLGLRKPYTSLQRRVKLRAQAMRNNMLVGLATLNSLLAAGMGVQEAMRRTAQMGGAFCNWVGLLVARMEIEDFAKAIEVGRAHVPDLRDVEIGLFLKDLEDFFVHNRPLLASTTALQESVHRILVEDTEARASIVRQRSGLFGILSVLGLVLAMISPLFVA